MIAVIKYKNRMRVVFILGRDKGKVYILASEGIPGPLAVPLAKILYGLTGLSRRINVLKSDFTPIYKSAFRVLDNNKVVVVETYDKPTNAGRS